MSKYEIDALLHQHLTFYEDKNSEDETTSEEHIEQATSILVNYTEAKDTNPANIRNHISTVYKKKPNPKTKANKDSDSAK